MRQSALYHFMTSAAGSFQVPITYQLNPTIVPSASMSMSKNAGRVGSPGIVGMSPTSTTRKPAPMEALICNSTNQQLLCSSRGASAGATRQTRTVLQVSHACSPPGQAARTRWARPSHWRLPRTSTASSRCKWAGCRNPAWCSARPALLPRLSTPRCWHRSWRQSPRFCL